ncbi:hypothetical protein [Actinoplanes sp. NPDC051411]|uniref:hypothetical protein n=1 Tax=Actinoplanes sp. NPDC051411 TaxID=3155522 RepID=UPI00343CD585
MADLVLDYALLHDLASSMRDLKAKIKTDVDAGSKRAVVTKDGTVVSSSEVGNTTVYAALSAFFAGCNGPFKDSMDLLDKLAENFDGIAKAFFDVDADFSGKVDTERMQAQIAQWQADGKAYQHYLDIKDKSVTFQYYDENGNLQTGKIGLWDPNQKPPDAPGPIPSSIDGTSVGSNHTTVTTDSNGNITSETTTVDSGNGLTYTETTNYTYHDTNGDGKPEYVDYSSTITHSDGSSETTTKTTNTSDGSYVVKDTTKDGTSTSTVTPKPNGGSHDVTVDTDGNTTTTDVDVTGTGTGTKTVSGPNGTDHYTGNPDTGQWTLTSHDDPPPGSDPYADPDPYISPNTP